MVVIHMEWPCECARAGIAEEGSAEALVLNTDGCGLLGTGSSLLVFRNDLCTPMKCPVSHSTVSELEMRLVGAQ